MHRNKSVDVHQFAMVPRADIPRSSFRMQKGHKTTFEAGYLVPIYVDEVLPGDTFNLKATIFCRMATPIFPIMDNLHAETFFFFVPNRLVWTNWQRFMGERDPNPGSSISYTIPQKPSLSGGYAVGSLGDYLGLPTVGQYGAFIHNSNALPWRGYNLIYNQWFRDENLQDSAVVDVDDGPDTHADYFLRRRGKRHDYFTSCLPWTLKGGVSVQLPLGTAPVKTGTITQQSGINTPIRYRIATTGNYPSAGTFPLQMLGTGTGDGSFAASAGTSAGTNYPENLYANLDAATSATINVLRQSFQIQRLLERDARGGTRYTEIVRSHFGVVSPDARLQRPEYLGGGSTPVNVSPVPQTSATAVTGSTTPLGGLAGFATALGHDHGFTQSFTEHGFVIGLISVRADLTYQQGVRRMWARSTRYDFYFPAFAHLGEQAVLNKEIYADGSANDELVFGYQERWAEYRYNPSQITGLFRSTSAGTLDGWHLAQKFLAVPTLNDTFIRDTPPVERVIAAGVGAANAQFLCDIFFDVKAARPLPLYSVPGLIDHF